MSYVVLARKYRPQTFADLVGQEHVATTLANSIALGRIAHAFLFTGVRGVGKTTSARILAKALNCATGPTATPCGECPQCKDITIGADMDVIEMDAASNTGVDNIRDLQETLNYRPARDRFKVYIVDEVHMLSTSAWNAFLKTLEEPPPHVKFIFATTEVHKVPATILSRCQRYDFKLIAAAAVAGRVRQVLAAEGIEADEGAVNLVAREAAGSMRDAMSLLDQVIAWAGPGERISTEGATRVLGVAARSILHRLASALVKGEAGTAVEIVSELAESGYAIRKVASDFLEHLRDLVVAKVAPDGRGLVDVPDEEKADLIELAASASVEDLARLHLGLSRAFDEIATGASPRASFEMALVRLSRRPPLVPLDELLRRLGELERRLEGGGSSGGGGFGGAQARDAGPRDAGPRDPGPRAAPQRMTGREAGAGPGAEDRSAAEPPGAPPPAAPRLGSSPPPAPPVFPPAVAAPPTAAPSTAAPSTAVPPPASPSTGSSTPAAPASPVSQRVPPRGPPRTEVTGPVVDAPALADDDPALAAYRDIVADVHARMPGIASVLEHAALIEATPQRLAVGFEQGSFLAAQLGEAHAVSAVRDAARRRLGPDVVVEVVSVGREALGGTLARRASEVLRARVADAERQVREHPIVAAAVEILGAELREVHLPPELASAQSWERRGER